MSLVAMTTVVWARRAGRQWWRWKARPCSPPHRRRQRQRRRGQNNNTNSRGTILGGWDESGMRQRRYHTVEEEFEEEEIDYAPGSSEYLDSLPSLAIEHELGEEQIEIAMEEHCDDGDQDDETSVESDSGWNDTESSIGDLEDPSLVLSTNSDCHTEGGVSWLELSVSNTMSA